MLVVLWLVVVLIYLLLTIPILNKKQNWEDLKCFYQHGNGFSQDRFSD